MHRDLYYELTSSVIHYNGGFHTAIITIAQVPKALRIRLSIDFRF